MLFVVVECKSLLDAENGNPTTNNNNEYRPALDY